MLRIIPSMSAAGAKSYYSTSDYYTEGQTSQGTWRGRAAEMIGLQGTVRPQDWDAMCDNRRPGTGAKAKDALGAKTRDHKADSLTMPQLEEIWWNRLLPDETDAIGKAASEIGSAALVEDRQAAHAAVERAFAHCFERSAVLPERGLIAQALRNSYGLGERGRIEQFVREHDLIRRDRDGRTFVTTAEVLGEEKQLLAFARDGRGTCVQLGPRGCQISEPMLSTSQRSAAMHVLTSQDRVIMVRGAAGTGKTTMMKATVQGIEAGGRKVFAVAPSASASRGVLRESGFRDADTVARLLIDERLQDSVRGQVVWVDEAGLMGTRTTLRLFQLADRLDARVVLVGDKWQHGSVERGGVLQQLETEAGLRPAELKEIRRQRGEYKAAIQALSEGNVALGFRRLDELGWIREIGDRTRHDVLAEAYCESLRQPGETLVICPTHREGDKTVAAIRASLHDKGLLGKREIEYRVLRPVQMTRAERSDPIQYLPFDVLQFDQNAKGFKRGQQLIVGIDAIPYDQAERFSVYRPGTLRLAAGDRIRITKNSTFPSLRLNNGDLRRVVDIRTDGRIVLDGDHVLPSTFCHLEHGYVVTSFQAQGKSVDRVIIAQGSESYPASNRSQFYVSASRGKRQATVFTDDRAALLAAVSQCDDRMTATQLATSQAPTHDVSYRSRRSPQVVPLNRIDFRSPHSPSQEVRRDR